MMHTFLFHMMVFVFRFKSSSCHLSCPKNAQELNLRRWIIFGLPPFTTWILFPSQSPALSQPARPGVNWSVSPPVKPFRLNSRWLFLAWPSASPVPADASPPDTAPPGPRVTRRGIVTWRKVEQCRWATSLCVEVEHKRARIHTSSTSPQPQQPTPMCCLLFLLLWSLLLLCYCIDHPYHRERYATQFSRLGALVCIWNRRIAFGSTGR